MLRHSARSWRNRGEKERDSDQASNEKDEKDDDDVDDESKTNMGSADEMRSLFSFLAPCDSPDELFASEEESRRVRRVRKD